MGYNRPTTYVLSHICATALTPVDATTYYLGPHAANMGATIPSRVFLIPRTGRIRAAVIRIYSAVADGTNEDWTWLIRNVTTATDHPFVMLAANTTTRVFSNLNLDIPVTALDEVTFKTTTPTWATNPDGCSASCYLLIESA